MCEAQAAALVLAMKFKLFSKSFNFFNERPVAPGHMGWLWQFAVKGATSSITGRTSSLHITGRTSSLHHHMGPRLESQ